MTHAPACKAARFLRNHKNLRALLALTAAPALVLLLAQRTFETALAIAAAAWGLPLLWTILEEGAMALSQRHHQGPCSLQEERSWTSGYGR